MTVELQKFCSRIITLFCALVFLWGQSVQAQSVLNPNDPIVNYNSASPPVKPQYNTIGKWVRTPRMGWNADSYKCYYLNGSVFRLKFPKTFQYGVNDGKKYPMIVMWHGKGEAGTIYDNEYQLYHGGEVHRNAVDNGQFDGFVLFMQNQNGSWGSAQFSIMNKFIDIMVAESKLDIDRISFHGLSAGGTATWSYMLANIKYVACALPMSAQSLTNIQDANMEVYKYTPVWTFQGGLDANPTPVLAQTCVDALRAKGANLTYTLYPETGHGTWYNAYVEPDFFPFMLRAHKANPYALFGKTTYCNEESINTTLGLSPGFDGYEWRKNGQTISGASGNSIVVTETGSYDARIKRGSTWSDWSIVPVVISRIPAPAAQAVSLVSQQSKVLPSPDGLTSAALIVGSGVGSVYQWYLNGGTTAIANTQTVTVTAPGSYTAKVSNERGCLSDASAPIVIVDANGPNKPDAATQLVATTVSQTSIQLQWQQTAAPAFNETGFEIYRSTTSGSAYKYVGVIGADQVSFTDQNLVPNKTYYYIVRAINATGASAVSNQASAVTNADLTAPTAPSNLRNSDFTESSISLLWNASTDNVGISRYDVYMNGSLVGATTSTGFTAGGLTANQPYYFYVIAYDTSGNASPRSNQITAYAYRKGLSYKYYQASYDALPNFATQTIVKSGRVANVTLAPRLQDDNFAFLWEGYINIPVNGTYTFRTNSDDGSRLYLSTYSASATPLVDNDGLHGPQYREGTITLTKGVYPISMTFFEKGGGEVMEVSWRTPETNGNWTSIPDSVFVDFVPPAAVAPAAPSALTATTLSYKEIRLQWQDNSTNETSFEIYRSTSAGGTFQLVATAAANAISLIDTALAASTTYYYKIKAAGATGQSDFNTANPVVNATTANLPAAPPVPTSPAVELIGVNGLKLSWTGTNSATVSYAVFKSTDNNNFQQLAIVAGADTTATYSYTDSSLAPHTTFYYKVRAANDGGQSAFTAVVSGTTGNHRPQLQPQADVYLRSTETKQVALQATDVDGDAIVFSSYDLPAFATLAANGNTAASLSIVPNTSSLGNYLVHIVAADGHSGTDTMAFQIIVNDNTPPVISTPAPATVNVDEGGSFEFIVQATDVDASNVLTWTTTPLPPFAVVTHPAAGSLKISLQPGYNHSGSYAVKLYVNDGNGGIDSSSFNIVVANVEPGYHIYLNFNSSSNNQQTGVWNNTNKAPVAGESFTGLKDANGVTTAVALTTNAAWSATTTGKTTGDNSGVYPDKVLSTVWSLSATTTQTMVLSGLNTGYNYNLVFFASKNDASNTYRGVRYTVNGISADLNVTNNTSGTATLVGLVPDAQGKLTISIDRINPVSSPNPGIHIGALEIIGNVPSVEAPAKPQAVAAVAAGNAINLSWNDMAYNENRYEIYRLKDNAAGEFSLVATLAANSNTFSDTDVAGNHTYSYFVKAGNTAGTTNSDTVSLALPNIAPDIADVANVTLNINETRSINFSATDSEGEALSFSSTTLPSFATLTDNGNRTATISLTPGTGQQGIYPVEVVVADGYGGRDTARFTITVLATTQRSIWINLNGATSTNEGAPYNNLGGSTSGGRTLTLNDNTGSSTGITMTFVNAWTANFTNGGTTGNNSGMFTDLAMSTGITATDATTRTIRFANLPTGKKFTVYFFGSRTGQSGTRNIVFNINGSQVVLNGANNTGTTVQLNELVANQDNQLILSVSRGDGNTAATFLNAMRIDIVDNDNKPAAPTNLVAVGGSRHKINLGWTDNAGTETGYLVYRSASASGTFTQIANLPANSVAYADQDLATNTTYYYKVVAAASPLNSDPSATVAGSTLKYTAYINFSIATDEQAPAPWNNMARDPLTTSAPMAILDEEGNNLGASLSITRNFTAGNNLGYVTGNNSGIFPDAVMKTVYWVDAGLTGSFKISGLNPSQQYSFTFFASRKAATAGDTRTTLYTVNGTQSATLQVVDNSSRTVTIANISPNATGEVTFDVSMPAGQSFGYIGALVIEALGDGAQHSSARVGRSTASTTVAAVATTPSQTDVKGLALTAYPNPMTGNVLSVQITTKQPLQNATLKLFSVSGRLAHQQPLGNLPQGSNNVKLNLAPQAVEKGLMLIQVTDEKGYHGIIKIVKQ